MSRNQDGFSAVECVIVVAVIVALACICWLVVARSGQKPIMPTSKATKSLANQPAPKPATSAKVATGSQQATPTGSPQNCTAPSLSLSVGMPQETAGTIYTDITYTNTSSQSCIVQGFPTVTLADGQGNDLGKPADNNGSSNGPVTLVPNHSTTATISVPNPGFLSPGVCTASAAYVVVSAPNDPRYLQGDYHEAYCPGLAVSAFKPSS